MPHILIVCTANICRSPVAEALIRQQLSERGLTPESGWTVASAGTWAVLSRPPAKFSQQLAAERGLKISDRLSMMVDAEMIADADLILCMEKGHKEALQAEFPGDAGKVHLLSELIDRNYSISDPYGQNIDAYRIMMGEFDNILEEGVDKLVELAQRESD